MRVLLVILIFSTTAWGNETPPASAPTAAGQEKKALHVPRLSWSFARKVTGDYQSAPWVKDPFFPAHVRFRLAGLIAPHRAFINGQWVVVGDEVDGYLVKKIQPVGVTLTRRGETVVLKPD